MSIKKVFFATEAEAVAFAQGVREVGDRNVCCPAHGSNDIECPPDKRHFVMVMRPDEVSAPANLLEKGEAWEPFEAREYRTLAPSYGLPSDGLGRTFVSQGKTFKITGFNSRAPRFPVLVERVRDGRRFKMPISAVKAGLTV